MIDKNDPRLTAYALGELEAAEAATFEAALVGETEAQGEVSDIRRAAEALRLALADETAPALTDGQREAIRTSAARGATGRHSTSLRLLAWTLTAAAACLAIAFFAQPYTGTTKQPLALAQPPAPTHAAEPLAAAADLAVAPGNGAASTDGAPAAPPPPASRLGEPSPAQALAEAAPVMLSKSIPPPTAAANASHPVRELQPAPRSAALAMAAAAVSAAAARPVTAEPAATGDGYATLAPGGPERRAAAALPVLRKDAAKAASPPAAPLAPAPADHAVAAEQTTAAPARGTAAPAMAATGMPAPGGAAGGRSALAGDAAAPAPRAPALASTSKALREIVYADAVRAAAPVNVDGDASVSDNPFRSVSQAPQSTFALADHTASYASVRNSLNKGQLPPRDAVRIAGLVNYFRYGDEAPAAGLPFGVRAEVAPCPWKPEQRLVRIAVNRGRSVAGPKVVAALDAVQETERGQPAAGDVRLQAEFSPARVAVYRLIGDDFALNHGRLNEEAGSVGALRPGQSVNAFYQVIPTPSAAPSETAAGAVPAGALAKAPPRRSAQQADGVAAPPDTLLTVTLRWEPVDARDTGVLVVPVPDRPQAWAETSPDMQFGSAVALFGMLLRQSPYAAGASFDTVLTLATPAAGRDTQGERAEFLELVRRARTAQPAPPPR